MVMYCGYFQTRSNRHNCSSNSIQCSNAVKKYFSAFRTGALLLTWHRLSLEFHDREFVVPVAERFKERVCCRALTEVADSNPAGRMEVRVVGDVQ